MNNKVFKVDALTDEIVHEACCALIGKPGLRFGHPDVKDQYAAMRAVLLKFTPFSSEALAIAARRKLYGEWFNLVMHAGIDARQENAPKTLARIKHIGQQISDEMAKLERVLGVTT